MALEVRGHSRDGFALIILPTIPHRLRCRSDRNRRHGVPAWVAPNACRWVQRRSLRAARHPRNWSDAFRSIIGLISIGHVGHNMPRPRALCAFVIQRTNLTRLASKHGQADFVFSLCLSWRVRCWWTRRHAEEASIESLRDRSGRGFEQIGGARYSLRRSNS